MFFFHTENLFIEFFSINFKFLSSLGFSWNLNEMQDVYKVNPKFIPLFRLSENWIYWYSPSMFIKWDLSIRITDLKFISETIEVSFSGITTAFSLLDSIEGFLFRYKSTILLPLYAVAGLKDVSKQFWQKQEVFLAYNLFRVEKISACSFLKTSTD